MALIDSITDYSTTQRVVLFIDLNPLLHLSDPSANPYLTSLLATAKTLLSFPPLSSSLFSFNLESLTQTLTSLLSTIDRTSISSLSPRSLHLAASMRQLVHDYAWDSVSRASIAVWGFCSSESIVLGSALVPFGLIYPRIGISPRLVTLVDSCKSINAQLSLEILDCCDIELVDFNCFSGVTPKFMDPQTDSFEQENMIWENFHRGMTKLHVKAVKKHDKCAKFEGFLSDPILFRELARDTENGQSESMEMGNLVPKKSVLIWEMLFSFLYREDYWAFVSLLNGNENSLKGILKPFIVSLALLSIMRDHSITNKFDGAGSGQFVIETDTEICKSQFDSLLCSHRFPIWAFTFKQGIQCHLQGGFLGDWRLDKYVGKVIKKQRIYAKMDMLLFEDEDEDESSNSLLNSEDSKKSNNDLVSAEDETFQLVGNEHQSPQGMNREEHAYLERVSAPKRPRAMKMKSGPLQKLSKRKEQRRVSYVTVCETPMTAKKRSCWGGSSGKEHGC
ncbi:hypothetical protein P3X46_030505 [Hevea brasiliensis]|uniref:Uncharacterized protein n=1 Tax=Hevea brasiliensis TaxID=3981 RepID=A0ABQ9KIG3_HEVBR|nr:hypothetical protein P3X46_030505 [Hevea brasiliensis]